MINENINLNNVMFFMLLLMSILPVVIIGSFGIPVLYLLIPIGVFLLLFIMFEWISVPNFTKYIIFIFLLIITEIIISTLYGSFMYFNKFIFPTDIIQYIARLICLITFITIFYSGKIQPKTFIKYFLIILNLGMLIGILQWLPWSGREIFIKLYPFREGDIQLSQLNREIHNIRVHGLAQMATANGGLAVFFLIFGYSVLKYYKKYKVLSLSLIILSVINLFASQSRAGIVALIFASSLFYLINIFINRKPFKPTIYLFITFSTILLVGKNLYDNGNPFITKMFYRWDVLFETSGGSRVDHIGYFASLLENPFQYLFGLSKQVVNQSAISHGVEIETINIFFSYGALGFLVQYLLIFMLLVYFLKNIRNTDDSLVLTLLVSAFVGLLSYQVFSIGYFFFREIRVGLFPWILMGVAIGVYERQRIFLIHESK